MPPTVVRPETTVLSVTTLALLACGLDRRNDPPPPAPAPAPAVLPAPTPVAVTAPPPAPQAPQPAAPTCVRANVSGVLNEGRGAISFGLGGKCQEVTIENGGANVDYRCALAAYGRNLQTGQSVGGMRGGTFHFELRQKNGDRYSGVAYAAGRKEGSLSISYAKKFDDAKGTFATGGKQFAIVFSPC